ncbi:hypothetical protein DY000_02020210 [Brassica cretica]|uniref:SCP domain-containing protein n=1 Tax=Brassica cretica TaxID=69181 RepID=A0ABQ7E5B8_BRACR|nr:hypothetical protein DY000_02020210 [Brassica cretica]
MKKLSFIAYSFTFVTLSSILTTQAFRHSPVQPPKANANADVNPKETLAVHNKARALVGVGPMVWNETLATYAQSYAYERARDCVMKHSSGPYGENLAAGWGMMNGEGQLRVCQ